MHTNLVHIASFDTHQEDVRGKWRGSVWCILAGAICIQNGCVPLGLIRTKRRCRVNKY